MDFKVVDDNAGLNHRSVRFKARHKTGGQGG